MTRRLRAAALWVAIVAALGCERPPAEPSAPTAELTQRAVRSLLPGLQFGPDPARDVYRTIRAVDVAGAHYVPGANRWIVHYCVEFTSLAGDAPLRRCDIGVEVYALDTKKWVGFARGAGTLYRWQLLEPDAPGDGAAQPAAP
jgi:hypothetical protein